MATHNDERLDLNEDPNVLHNHDYGKDNGRAFPVPVNEAGQRELKALLRKFDQSSLTTIGAEDLQYRKERQDSGKMRRSLQKKTQFERSSLTVPTGDPSLVWGLPVHNFDSICVVSSSPGFEMLAGAPDASSHELELSPKLSHWALRDKYLDVPFNIAGRTFFLGRLNGSQIWIVFQPIRADAVDEEAEPKFTSISERRSLRFTLLWASCLQELQGTLVYAPTLPFNEVDNLATLNSLTNFRCAMLPSARYAAIEFF